METSSPVPAVIDAITLRQLQYFIAVAEAEHFTRASERLLVAQPSLSRHVKELEEALGVALFVRDARGVRLTDAGRELLHRAREIVLTLQTTVEAVRAVALGERGRLRFGYYGPSFYNNLVTRSALERFREESPDVDVVSHELFSEQVIQALREGLIDLGISRGIARAADIESRVIATERLVVWVAESDPLAARPSIALADLRGRGAITFPTQLTAGFSERLAAVADRAGLAFDVVREVTQLSSIAHYVAQNEGVSIQPRSSGGSGFPGVAIKEISDPHATIDLVLQTRRGEAAPAALRFIRLLETTQADNAN